jgi:hypothetical protein
MSCLLGAASAEEKPSRYVEPYPSATSKKGLQVEMVEDALALGVKHATLNFNLCQLIAPDANANSPGWELEGRRHGFRAA